MPDYLLDSNHANRLIDPRHPVWLRIRSAIEQGDVRYLILPVITETVFGFSILPRAERNRLEWQAVRAFLVLLDRDEVDAMEAARAGLADPLGWRMPPAGTAPRRCVCSQCRQDVGDDNACMPGVREPSAACCPRMDHGRAGAACVRGPRPGVARRARARCMRRGPRGDAYEMKGRTR